MGASPVKEAGYTVIGKIALVILLHEFSIGIWNGSFSGRLVSRVKRRTNSGAPPSVPLPVQTRTKQKTKKVSTINKQQARARLHFVILLKPENNGDEQLSNSGRYFTYPCNYCYAVPPSGCQERSR